MARYTLIDDFTGFVWGEAEADSPETACRLVDERLGETGRQYERVAELPGNEPGYHVHEAPADFREVVDGSDDDEIAAVEALPRVALVAITLPAEG